LTLRAHDGLHAREGGFWTFEKLTYLKKYADAFMNAMRPKPQWNRLEFIDLLCGPGIDIIEGKGEQPGSPLIALTTTPPFDKLHLGDLNQRNVEALP
jgi:three-Cys-motif partner protein